MKRILVLNYEFPPLGGGASPVSYELAQRLSNTGEYDLDVVTMGYGDLPRFEALSYHLRVYRVRCLRSKKEMSYPWEQLSYLAAAYLLCRRLLRQNAYDVCHCHFIIPTGALALRLKQKYGLEFIITAHGSDVLGYNKRFERLYPLLKGPWQNILNQAKAVISPSHFLKREILRMHPALPEEKVAVIPNGIDTAKFIPQAKKPYIFSSGRLLSNKGFQHLIEAVAYADIGWEVHIAGDGPLRSELELRARKSKTRIVFHGWLDNRGGAYKDLLEQASVYVLASQKENASIALLEAMSAGCAMITTNASGTAETVGESGLLVAPESAMALRGAIYSLVSDTKKLAQYQSLARVMTEREYAYPAVIDRYRAFI